MDIEAAAAVTGKSRLEKTAILLVGVTAVVAALLGTLEVHSSKQEERALALGARLPVEASAKLAGGGIVSSFQLGSLSDATLLGVEATSRLVESFESFVTAELAQPLGLADELASGRLIDAVGRMVRAGRTQELDAFTHDVITSDPFQAGALVEEQNRQIDLADRYGKRGNRAVFALSLAAIAAVLLALSLVVGGGRAGGVVVGSAALALVASSAAGVSALLI
jgi:hypothetical protein